MDRWIDGRGLVDGWRVVVREMVEWVWVVVGWEGMVEVRWVC